LVVLVWAVVARLCELDAQAAAVTMDLNGFEQAAMRLHGLGAWAAAAANKLSLRDFEQAAARFCELAVAEVLSLALLERAAAARRCKPAIAGRLKSDSLGQVVATVCKQGARSVAAARKGASYAKWH